MPFFSPYRDACYRGNESFVFRAPLQRKPGHGAGARVGQPVIIDNKPGASGIIGTRAALSAAPDGYTLVSVGVTNGASNKSLFRTCRMTRARTSRP